MNTAVPQMKTGDMFLKKQQTLFYYTDHLDRIILTQ